MYFFLIAISLRQVLILFIIISSRSIMCQTPKDLSLTTAEDNVNQTAQTSPPVNTVTSNKLEGTISLSTPEIVNNENTEYMMASETDSFEPTIVTDHTTNGITTTRPRDYTQSFTHSATCDIIENADSLTQDQFSSLLTNGCRYDRLLKPVTGQPLHVIVQADIAHIEAAEQLQFKMHMLVQYRYLDRRLDYSQISPHRGNMIGETKLKDKIWIPHVVLSNERDTSIMGLEGKDVFVSISPKGEVIYSYRMTALIYCWMDLKKFPFDEQICNIHFKSWTYNTTQLLLNWEEGNAVTVASQLHLTEFKFTNHWTHSTKEPASFNRGAFNGNYSTLVFQFQITREIGYYIMDYFIPSIMLVCTSWVTFWLQADNAAPRITLGTSTMLSFITLASGQSKNLPKVSYIKASEIWFLGCTMFIFASIAEFAFVNIIWRRKKKVELKKMSSKYILKSTFTPKLARRDLQRSSSASNLHKSHSCSSLEMGNNTTKLNNGPQYNNYLTVHSFQGLNVPTITTQSDDDLISKRHSVTTIRLEDNDHSAVIGSNWTTMTPQEIAIWIDRRSRLVFPIAFLIFNIFYWSFVYVL